MEVIALSTLSFATRRGYLVPSGESLGKDDLERDVFEDDDIVIDDVQQLPRGWLIRYHPVHVRPR